MLLFLGTGISFQSGWCPRDSMGHLHTSSMSLSSWTYDKNNLQKTHSKDAKKNYGDGMWRIFLIPKMDPFEDFKLNEFRLKLPLKCECLEPKKKTHFFWTCFRVVTSFGPFSMTPWRSLMQGCPKRSNDKNQPLETRVSIYFEEKTAETSPERGTSF